MFPPFGGGGLCNFFPCSDCQFSPPDGEPAAAFTFSVLTYAGMPLLVLLSCSVHSFPIHSFYYKVFKNISHRVKSLVKHLCS